LSNARSSLPRQARDIIESRAGHGERKMAATPVNLKSSEAAIFARVWEGDAGGLTLPVGRHVLKLGFGPWDNARMRELVERHRTGQLTDDEREELDNFVRVGDLLAILQSKARKRLRQDSTARNGHG